MAVPLRRTSRRAVITLASKLRSTPRPVEPLEHEVTSVVIAAAVGVSTLIKGDRGIAHSSAQYNVGNVVLSAMRSIGLSYVISQQQRYREKDYTQEQTWVMILAAGREALASHGRPNYLISSNCNWMGTAGADCSIIGWGLQFGPAGIKTPGTGDTSAGGRQSLGIAVSVTG